MNVLSDGMIATMNENLVAFKCKVQFEQMLCFENHIL